MEIQAKALSEYLAKTVPASIESRRRRTAETAQSLAGVGIQIAEPLRVELDALATPPADAPWATTVGRLKRVEDGLASAQQAFIARERSQALAVATWADLSAARRTEVSGQIDAAVEPASDGRVVEAVDGIRRLLRTGLPEASHRREQSRDAARRLATAAAEFGAGTARIEAALRGDQEAPPERWPETVGTVDAAIVETGEALRDRGRQSLDALRTSLTATREYGVDPTTALRAVEQASAALGDAPPLEIGGLLGEARRVAEEPIVTVVAGLLDEVRPRIAEARRLGRDPSDVFAAMNRAREALRLKIYSEALAASQEAVERVARLTEDLEDAREEFAAVEEMFQRLRRVGFSTDPFDPAIQRIRGHLDRAEAGPAVQLMRETLLGVGRDALKFFLQRWTALDAVRTYARDRGFLTPAIDADLSEARKLLDGGQLADGVERLASAEVALRTAAQPYVAGRIEEMERGFADIPDETLAAPIRRLLADADVTLRVKLDLLGSVESLRRAELDFSAVFAAHASSLVEELEAENRILESMGGPGDEIQRQIDEVQQIFNMGDFVQASRASQEIRKRARQQQLLRSEESVSHAKLALVELETMGLDLTQFRAQLDEAQAAARAAQYAEAFKIATRLEEAAQRTWTSAQEIVDGLARAQEMIGRVRESGADTGPFYATLREARQTFQALDFERARAQVEQVLTGLENEGARAETARRLAEIDRLIEDGRRLALPMEAFLQRLAQLKTEQATGPPAATLTAARLVHEELVGVLRPVLEENLRGLERDLDIARGAGVVVDKILQPLAEARRRIALPVPTGAAALLDEARGEFVDTRGLVEHAERMARRARDALAEAELLRVEVAPLRAAMDRLESGLAQRQYARVIELGVPLERELLQATYQHVSKTLAGFQATVTRLRREGVDTTIAENLLHQARMALDEGKAVQALQFASRSEAELERVELQRRIAEGSLQSAERALAHAAGDGIVAPDAVDEVGRARSAFQERDYPTVFERALSASDILSLARDNHRRAKDALAAANRQFAEAKTFEADAKEAKARLDAATRSAEAGEYGDAVRAAREATEMARWAIERLFAAPLGELRRTIEQARREQLPETDLLESIVGEAENALRARDWQQVGEAIDRAELAGRRSFETVIDSRWRDAEAETGRGPTPTPGEAARREEVRQRLQDLRSRRDYPAALEVIRTELDIVRRRRREQVEQKIAELKSQLWVGERLGLDTTPVMQVFSEARTAADQHKLDEAERLVADAQPALERAVRDPFLRRQKDVATELNFAQEGLHVSVAPVTERMREVEVLDRTGRLLDAAKALLSAEEELNLRKSLHRELLNLHYLIDAALARAQQANIDTSRARQLLAESIRLRETDYPAALEKAREALKLLQGEAPPAPGSGPASATAPAAGAGTTAAPAVSPSFWPFRRPPAEKKDGGS